MRVSSGTASVIEDEKVVWVAAGTLDMRDDLLGRLTARVAIWDFPVLAIEPVQVSEDGQESLKLALDAQVITPRHEQNLDVHILAAIARCPRGLHGEVESEQQASLGDMVTGRGRVVRRRWESVGNRVRRALRTR